MTIAHKLLVSVMIAGSILVHAYITRPPRYHFFPSRGYAHSFHRGDARTGDIIECQRDERPDGAIIYRCPP